MSSEFATTVSEHAARRRFSRLTRRQVRPLAVLLLGPLTMVAGFVWAVVQPYRIAFLYPEGKGAYDYLVQPPLLVVLVGLVFALAVAPGLVDDLERSEHGPSR